MSELDNILKKIPQSDNICFFPLRLETHFDTVGNKKQLLVRVIPDEILLDYHKDGLSSEEIEDGKVFWMQWYIASGSPSREYAAWLNLCAKYPTSRAAWICRVTKLVNWADYFNPGSLFKNRPYPNIKDIESKCENIIKNLGLFSINEDGITTSKDSFEKSVEELFNAIRNDLNDIDYELMVGSEIVDYLYDTIFNMLDYLGRRIDVFKGIYEKFSELNNNTSSDQIFKRDVQALNDLTFRWNDVREKFKDYRASLSSVVAKQKERIEKGGGFPKCNVLPKKNFEIPEPTMLPDRFVFVGEAIDANKKVVNGFEGGIDFEYGVDRKIKMSIDPDGGSDYSADSSNGQIKVDPSVEWMFDYNAAVRAGMATTITLPNNVTGFNYIYVFGVKNNSLNKDYLSDLFNGHNYLGKGLRLLNPRTPTNIVGGEKSAEETADEEKELRYKRDVEKGADVPDNDSQNIAKLLNSDYTNCWKHIVNFDQSTDSKTKLAYSMLWSKLGKSVGTVDDFIGGFFVNYVRASGSIPAIKVGNLPYGIFTVSDFQKLKEVLVKSRGKNDKICLLLSDLCELKKEWDRLSASVPNPATLKGVNAEKTYLEMAGQTPYSISFIERQEIESSLIEKNVPQIGLNDSIFNKLFEKYRANLPVKGTDKIWHIEKSEFVKALVNGKVCDEADAVNYVTEFIDLFTYRLDAWFNGVLMYVLDSTNNIKTSGTTQIGAYGWVFDLQQKPSSTSNEGNDHYVVAPSIQHALTAAVLRSAYLESKSCKTDSHVCVNLSSMRARQALRLVDGIRSGMSMSVVLGCDLERYLHDAALHGKNAESGEMDKFINPLRKLFPQLVTLDAEDSRAESYVMQVINGEALLETIINHDDWTWNCTVRKWLEDHFNDEKMAWLQDSELSMTLGQREIFFKIIERLMDSYDALNDLLLSESVHRLVMGDHESFVAIGNFLANGEGNIPEPEILKTPSEHVVVSHKAGMILPQLPEISEKDIDKVSAFRIAEASVDSWVDSLIGGMNKISFFVKYNDGTSDVAKECSLSEVGVSASEYLYLSANPATFLNYLETRWCLNPENNYVGKVSVLESAEEAKIPCSEGRLSLEEDALRIQTIRSLLGKSRGMLPSDWNADIQEDKDDEDSIDLDDLAKRGANLIVKVKKLSNNLDDWIQLNSVTDVADNGKSLKGELGDKQVNLAYGYLCDCIEFGLVNCFTGFNPNAYMDKLDKVLQSKEREESLVVQEDLLGMVVSAYGELGKRIKEFFVSIGVNEKDETNGMSSEKIIAQLKKMKSDRIVEAIQNLTLKNIKIFPKFKLEYKKLEFGTYSKKASEKNYSFVKQNNVKFDSFVKNGLDYYSDNVGFESFVQWQDEIAEVREGMKDVQNLSMAQTALGCESFDASIFQTTTVIVQNSKKEQSAELKCLNGYWLGMPVKEEGLLRDADSLVLYNVKDFKSQDSIVGFIFDAWLEYIPYKKHSAGLVFHCDKPDAEAPQTLLLGVNPNTGSAKWDLKCVVNILNTTREMMKDRAVDPDLIYSDGQCLSDKKEKYDAKSIKLSRMFPLFNTDYIK